MTSLHYYLLIPLESKKPDSRGSQESAGADQASKSIGDAKNNENAGQLDVSSSAVTPNDASDNVLKLPRLTAVLEIAEGKPNGIDEGSENGDEESIQGKA